MAASIRPSASDDDPDNVFDPPPAERDRRPARSAFDDGAEGHENGGAKSTATPRHHTIDESGDLPASRCRIGHCVEMPHMAFVDWQAPTPAGMQAGLFTVNLTRPMTLTVESHPTSARLRRLVVVCGEAHIANIDTLAASATSLHADLWDMLASARTNYAANARRYRRAREQKALAEQREAEARPARGEARSASPRSAASPPSRQPLGSTGRAILLGVAGYILLSALAFGGYHFYTNAPASAPPPTEAPATPGASQGGATESASPGNDTTPWQPDP